MVEGAGGSDDEREQQKAIWGRVNLTESSDSSRRYLFNPSTICHVVYGSNTGTSVSRVAQSVTDT